MSKRISATLGCTSLIALAFFPNASHAIVNGGTGEDRATFGSVLRFGTIDDFTPSRGCSAVLISDRLALTSAHCFPQSGEFSAKIFTQMPGSNTTACITWRTPTTADPEERCVERRLRVVQHPSYSGNDDDSESDIAVVHIINNHFRLKESPISKTSFARLYADNLHNSKWMIMAGFGPVLPSGVGHGEYHESRFARTGIRDHHFFYDNGPNSRTCKGDSGGPALLIAKGGDVSTDVVPASHPIVVGLLSNRSPEGGNIWCGENGARSRWTKVSPKVEWISETAKNLTGKACRAAHETVANVKYSLCFD